MADPAENAPAPSGGAPSGGAPPGRAPSGRAPSAGPVLQITDLHTEIRLRDATVHAVDGVSLSVAAGECLGLVGESGCGKTMTARSVMRLLPAGGVITAGSIVLAGTELTNLSERSMQEIRGNDVGMVFQDPSACLDPTMTIGRQITESVVLHQGADRQTAVARAVEMLGLVRMPEPERVTGLYPHQLSGGMRQRAMIAAALACKPQLLIADEPTTALDVTIQREILELIDDLRGQLGMAVILVTHDLGVIAGRTERVAVMYGGKIIEHADTAALFAGPRHPYTEALFDALPEMAGPAARSLYSIPGLAARPERPRAGMQLRAAVPLRARLVREPRAGPGRRSSRPHLRVLIPARPAGARRCRRTGRPGRPAAGERLGARTGHTSAQRRRRRLGRPGRWPWR